MQIVVVIALLWILKGLFKKTPNTKMGKVLIKQLDQIGTLDGYFLPEDQPNPWGEIIEIGPPRKSIYSGYDMFMYHLFGDHPCGYEVGDVALIPRTGRKMEREDGIYFIFDQHEIAYCEKKHLYRAD